VAASERKFSGMRDANRKGSTNGGKGWPESRGLEKQSHSTRDKAWRLLEARETIDLKKTQTKKKKNKRNLHDPTGESPHNLDSLGIGGEKAVQKGLPDEWHQLRGYNADKKGLDKKKSDSKTTTAQKKSKTDQGKWKKVKTK